MVFLKYSFGRSKNTNSRFKNTIKCFKCLGLDVKCFAIAKSNNLSTEKFVLQNNFSTIFATEYLSSLGNPNCQTPSQSQDVEFRITSRDANTIVMNGELEPMLVAAVQCSCAHLHHISEGNMNYAAAVNDSEHNTGPGDTQIHRTQVQAAIQIKHSANSRQSWEPWAAQ